jgi:hypothetical protein
MSEHVWAVVLLLETPVHIYFQFPIYNTLYDFRGGGGGGGGEKSLNT